MRDPLERDPILVAQDVINNLISRDITERIYGVILDPNTYEIRSDETSKHRNKLTLKTA